MNPEKHEMAALKKIGEGANYTLYEDERGNPLIKIDGVRFSYPFVGTPGEDENDAGDTVKKWRIVGMLPKATHVAAKDAVKKIITDLIAKNEVKIPNSHWFLTNGDDKDDENMHGHWLVSASDGRIRPTVRDRKGQLILEVEKIDEMIYGGCWGNILIRPWYFNGTSKQSKKTLPKRIVAGLTGVQFVKDDKPFGSGRIDDTDAWGAVDDGDDGMGGGSSDSDDDI
jgi:hypothetical protein